MRQVDTVINYTFSHDLICRRKYDIFRRNKQSYGLVIRMIHTDWQFVCVHTDW